MGDGLEHYFEGLLPAAMLRRSLTTYSSQVNLIRDLLKQRKVPNSGWPDDVIRLLMKLLSMMDSDKDLEGVRIGEREARVASPLVSELASGFCHGVGRSGSLISPQPKAPGASILYELSNRCALDALQRLGVPKVKSAFISPVATGMSIALALAAARDSGGVDRNVVVFPRVDHDSPLKAIGMVNLKPRIVEGSIYGDAVRIPVDKIAEAVRRLYQKAQLVHGDLSEYNIMIVDLEPVIFDFAQAVPPEHPMAHTFLERDLVRMNEYFSRIGVTVPPIERLTKWVTGEDVHAN